MAHQTRVEGNIDEENVPLSKEREDHPLPILPEERN